MTTPTQGKALPALSTEDKSQAKTLDATLHAEVTKPPPRYTEATLLSAMETAGKLVDDEELAEAMKERGLGTPATRADTIDGLIYQKYMDRDQRELVPSAKAEQLTRVSHRRESSGDHEPDDDRRMGTPVAPDGARKISAREIHGRHCRANERHRRARQRI